MGKFLKRTSVFVFAFIFALLPVVNVGAADRYVEITMHAGDYGHFEEGGSKDYTKTFFYADAFDDRTEPVLDQEGYVFAGWSTDPAATSVNVEVGETKAGSVGSDLYAVWSDKAYVFYEIYNGVWTNPADGEDYTSAVMEYNVGTTFQNLSADPRPTENVYDFVGWNTSYYGAGDRLVPGVTTINDYWTEVRVEWNYNPERIQNELILNKEEEISVGVSIPVYKFTAPETAVYEIYTDGIEGTASEDEDESYLPDVIIRVRDISDGGLASEKFIHPENAIADRDKHTFYKMTAGETYYIRFGEQDGLSLNFTAGIKKATMKTITFNANHGPDAWFDDDHKATKDIEIPVGDNIRYLNDYGFRYDSKKVIFNAWYITPEPEEDDDHNYLIVTEDMDVVYAGYTEAVAVNLDFNGGHHPYDLDQDSMVVNFPSYAKFETPIDPDIDDPTKDFAGWSRNPNVTEPDADILEGQTQATELDGETLYAVYGEKVLTTFVTNGGAYMLDDPSITTFESPRGNGHIFYGMMVMNPYGNRVKHVGWIDDKGTIINTTSDIDSSYRVNGDTTFTALLRYKINANGNGGHFTVGCGWGTCETGYPEISFYDEDSTFSYAEAKEFVGIPVSYEEGKYFLGYATTENAEGPDVIDGETHLLDLGTIYAVWGEYSAYVDEASESEYEKNSEDGLRLIVHRTDDDTKTFSMFSGLTMDGAYDYDEDEVITLSPDLYDAEEGSLILTLHSDYLNTLAAGDHVLSVHFNDIDSLDIDFAIAESEEDEDAVPVPNTGENSATTGTNGATASIIFSLAPLVLVALILLVVKIAISVRLRRHTTYNR